MKKEQNFNGELVQVTDTFSYQWTSWQTVRAKLEGQIEISFSIADHRGTKSLDKDTYNVCVKLEEVANYTGDYSYYWIEEEEWDEVSEEFTDWLQQFVVDDFDEFNDEDYGSWNEDYTKWIPTYKGYREIMVPASIELANKNPWDIEIENRDENIIYDRGFRARCDIDDFIIKVVGHALGEKIAYGSVHSSTSYRMWDNIVLVQNIKEIGEDKNEN